MAKTTIEWTDATWNPTRGCSRISEGCRHCYAERQAYRITLFDRGRGVPEGKGAYDGLVEMTSQGPKWTGELRLVQEKLNEPLKARKPRMYFVDSMSDLFHEKVPFDFVDQVFGVMGLCEEEGRGHTFQILTKRADRMREYMRSRGHKAWNSHRLGAEAHPPRNVWLGVSVESPAHYDRIELLEDTPARVRFISAEPLLAELRPPLGSIDWLICGGESGPGARLMKADWACALRDECAQAGVPFFFKQWGGRYPQEAGRLLDGVEHNGMPEVAHA